MRYLSLAGALLASTAVLMMMPDASGSGGPTPEFMSTIDALNSLDPDDDTNWTADGLPDVDVMEALTGNKWLSRGDLNGYPITRQTARDLKTSGIPLVPPDAETVPASDAPPPVLDPDGNPPTDQAPPPDALPPDPTTLPPATSTDGAGGVAGAPSTPISLCRLVVLTFDASAPFDGGTAAVGLVVKVNDDGSCNVKAFSPDGGSDGFFTGVRNTDDVLAMPDGAEKNGALACTWSFPPRV